MSSTMFPNSTSTNAEQVELLLTGFTSFAEINLVRKAISKLPGVSQVQARPICPGAMSLFVTYEGMVPFQVHVNELLRSRGRGRGLPAGVEIATAERVSS
ncbi:MAG: hypothetical protein M0R75_11410 [Dehalococcoidia bacterium]|nr:hypothetical protein [Dehalococcoidia bacterium]